MMREEGKMVGHSSSCHFPTLTLLLILEEWVGEPGLALL